MATVNPADHLKKLVTTRMPYGKYKGTIICDIPEHYIVWYYGHGLPKGEIGSLLSTMYEIRLNGLMYLLEPLRK